MSFQIDLEVDDQGLVKILNTVAKPPAGVYTIRGHRYQGENSAADYLSLSTPIGYVSVSAAPGRNVPVPE